MAIDPVVASGHSDDCETTISPHIGLTVSILAAPAFHYDSFDVEAFPSPICADMVVPRSSECSQATTGSIPYFWIQIMVKT